MNIFSTVLLGVLLSAIVLAWLIAFRRLAARPVQPTAVFNRRQDPEPSGHGPRQAAKEISGTQKPVSTSLPGTGRHILFVEDERHFAESGRNQLKQLGYHVTLVADANEALAVIRGAQEKIDCVVTDLSMPSMSGFDLARICQRLLPGVPVILMSRLDGPIADEFLHACGIHGLLSKPFTPQSLAEAVQRVFTGGKTGAKPD